MTLINPYETLFGTEVQLFSVISMIFIIVMLLNVIVDKDTSPQVVSLVGLALICLAATALWVIDQNKIWVETLKGKNLVSEAFAADFARRSNWFAYILPFFSAAIGTNLISDVITKRLHYEKPLTVSNVILGSREILKIVIGLCLLPFILLFAALPSILFGAVGKKLPVIRENVATGRRRLYLKVLKVDILIRSRPRKKNA